MAAAAASSSSLASSEPCSMGGGYLQEKKSGSKAAGVGARDAARVNRLRARGSRWSGDGGGVRGGVYDLGKFFCKILKTRQTAARRR